MVILGIEFPIREKYLQLDYFELAKYGWYTASQANGFYVYYFGMTLAK